MIHSPSSILYLELRNNQDAMLGSGIENIESLLLMCKSINTLGGNPGRLKCYAWFRDNLWFKESFATIDMQYGISEEPNAVLTYSNLIQVSVTPSGLRVNKKYVHPGASPDGLIIDPNSNELRGIIEIKSIKALRSKTIDEWIKNGGPIKCMCILYQWKIIIKKISFILLLSNTAATAHYRSSIL